MTRSLFRDKKRSDYLTHLKACMSLGKRMGCSKASAMWAECPLWNSLIEEFQGMVVVSTSSRGDLVRCWMRTSAPLGSSLLSTEVALLSLGSLAVFYYLALFWGTTSSSSSFWSFLFFLRLGLESRPRSVVGRGGGRGRLGGIWDLGTSCDMDPLFLLTIRSLRPFLWFKAISSSSSSDELSGRATTRIGVWTPESLSGSSSASNMGIIRAPWSSFSSSR